MGNHKLPAYAPNLDQKALLDYAASQGLDTVDCSASFRNIKTNTSIIKRIITLRALRVLLLCRVEAEAEKGGGAAFGLAESGVMR